MPNAFRYSVRTVHGAAKLASELCELSGEGWEPISFQHDAAGNFEVILRQDHYEHSNGQATQVEPSGTGSESARYAIRTVRAGRIDVELTDLSSDGWEPISFQHDTGGAYEVILKQDPSSADRKACYRYALRHMHGVTKLEFELADLSREGWEPVRIQRDGAGTYEAIVRQKIFS